ncbi:MAG: type II toxin-antitoxin system HicA family toxin [Nanoarchaeota archaeon]
MPLLRKLSGEQLLKILCNRLGFKTVRRRGSHVVIAKETPTGKVGTVIPMHSQVKIGTLKGILKQARISEEEFMQHV